MVAVTTVMTKLLEVVACFFSPGERNKINYNPGKLNLYKEQEQPSRSVGKRCSENMQQIYRRKPTPKCDFNKVALQLYWNRTSAWMFSCKNAAYFQNTFFLEQFWAAASERIKYIENIWSIYKLLKINVKQVRSVLMRDE